jgi:hypothetical protein
MVYKLNNIYSYIRYNIPTGVANLIKWLPVVWKDRDWDFTSVYDILRFKIENMSNYIDNRKTFVGYENEVKYMRLCKKLIGLISDDYYLTHYLDMVEAKWGPYNYVKDSSGKFFKHIKVKTQEDKEDCDRMTTEMLELATKMNAKAKRLLYHILEEHLEKWWD